MSLAVKVRIGGESGSTVWDATDQVPIFDADSQPLLDAGHMYGGDGNASQFQFEVDDPIGEIPRADRTKNLASHNVVTVIEDAPGFDCWIGRGRIADKGVSRGGDYRDDHRYFVATVDDGNTDFRGLALVAEWPRPAESGRARVLAALAAFCDGDPRLTTVIDSHLVAAGDEIMMPAHTYPATTDLPEIFRDCATTEGKLWGAVIHHLADVSHLCMLYILEADHTTFASGLSITDDDPDLATEFPPIWDQGDATIESGGDNPVSHLVSRYGADDAVVVAEQLWLIESYDYWAVPFYDSAAETQAQAQIRADAMAAGRSTEHVTHQVSIQITAEQVEQVGAGMSIDIKSAASMGGEHLGTTQTRRIGQCKFEKISPTVAGVEGYYLAHLQLNRPQKRMPERVGNPALTTKPNLCHDETFDNVCTDDFTRLESGSWGRSDIACLDWIASENGSHSVDGLRAEQVIDVADEVINDWLEVADLWDGATVDFTAKVAGTSAGVQKVFVAYESDGTVADYGPVDNPLTIRHFRWGWALGAAGEVSVSVFANRGAVLASTGYIAAGFNAVLTEFWVRCQLTAGGIRMKAWEDGDPEPGAWTAEANDAALDGINGIGDTDVFVVGQTALGDPGETLWISELTFAGGINCGTGTCIRKCTTGGPNASSGDPDDTEAATSTHDHDSVDTGTEASGDLAGTYPNPTVVGHAAIASGNLHPEYASDADLSAHTGDPSAAHDASAVSFDDTGLAITAANAQEMGEALDAAISAGGIPATIFDAAGDLIVASAADTAARLPMGTALQQIRVNVGATGLEYADPPAAGGSVVGLAPIAVQIGALVGSAPTTAQNLAASGGAVGIPMVVSAPMVLEAIEWWRTDASLARSAECALYVEDGTNDGTAARVAGSDGSVSGTPGAAARVVITPSGTPTLDPGIYWLVIRNTHATNTYGVGYAVWNATFWDDHASALIFTGLPALSSAIDVFAAASQAGVARSYGARLQGTYLGNVV